MRFILSLALLPVLFTGCAYSIHQVHVSDFAPFAANNSGTTVSANSEQFVILGFVSQTDYVDAAYKDLQSKCPKGHLTGISTQYSTSLGFFSWTNKILMQGRCSA